jgi:REP element-mobilizing transposase RayT
MEIAMSKPVPLQYGMYYHILNRGNNRENVFFEQRNYRHFLQLYAKYIEPVADTYAYCLLPNHFHLLVRIKTVEEQQQTLGVENQTPRVIAVRNPRGVMARVLKPSQQFSNLFNAYAKAINKAYGRTGSLFEHPFGRLAVTSDGYFSQLVVYIHRNPQKHGLVDGFSTWPYSSYPAMLSTKRTRWKRQEVLAWFDGSKGLAASHQQEAGEGEITPLILEDFE